MNNKVIQGLPLKRSTQGYLRHTHTHTEDFHRKCLVSSGSIIRLYFGESNLQFVYLQHVPSTSPLCRFNSVLPFYCQRFISFSTDQDKQSTDTCKWVSTLKACLDAIIEVLAEAGTSLGLKVLSIFSTRKCRKILCPAVKVVKGKILAYLIFVL